MRPPHNHWLLTRDGDPHVREIFDRHYSRRLYRDGRRPALFVGPGYKMVLITRRHDAIFAWRKFRPRDNQVGVNCSIFRNTGPVLSSQLIKEAEEWAAVRWPGERSYTYVNPEAVRSTNPGYCFQKAGWRRCGRSKDRHLWILESTIPLGAV